MCWCSGDFEGSLFVCFPWCVETVLLTHTVQYELATGRFPYPKWNSVFDQLTQVVKGEPPQLSNSEERQFSPKFITFVNLWWVKGTAVAKTTLRQLNNEITITITVTVVLVTVPLCCWPCFFYFFIFFSLTKDDSKRPKYRELLVSSNTALPKYCRSGPSIEVWIQFDILKKTSSSLDWCFCCPLPEDWINGLRFRFEDWRSPSYIVPSYICSSWAVINTASGKEEGQWRWGGEGISLGWEIKVLLLLLLQKQPFIQMYEERLVDVASYVCRILDLIPASPVSPMYVDWCRSAPSAIVCVCVRACVRVRVREWACVHVFHFQRTKKTWPKLPWCKDQEFLRFMIW